MASWYDKGYQEGRLDKLDGESPRHGYPVPGKDDIRAYIEGYKIGYAETVTPPPQAAPQGDVPVEVVGTIRDALIEERAKLEKAASGWKETSSPYKMYMADIAAVDAALSWLAQWEGGE